MIKLAAKLTRQKIQDSEADTVFGKVKLLTTITRTYWGQDTYIARRLINNTALGNTHLNIINRKVVLTDPRLFNDTVVEARRNYITRQSEELPEPKRDSNFRNNLFFRASATGPG